MVAPASKQVPAAIPPANTNPEIKAKISSGSKRRRRKLPKTPPPHTNGGAGAKEPGIDGAGDDGEGQGAEWGAMNVDDNDNRRANFDKEAKAIIELEKPRLWRCLEDAKDRAKDVEDKVASLLRRAHSEMAEDPGPRDEGASFLGLKQMLLLSYCKELCSYAAAKGRGEALRGGGAAGRLVELRAVMEKLRPLDRKLKYQTDKLLRLAASSFGDIDGAGVAGGTADDSRVEDGDDDPLNYRPRPESMAAWGEDPAAAAAAAAEGNGVASTRASAAAGQSAGVDQSGPYRAPRLASMPYDEDGLSSGAARGEKRQERRRDKLRRGEVLETLREEFGEQPETIRALAHAGASGVSEAKMRKLLEEDKERLDFEEDHMVRLTVTRKAKKARAQMERDAGRLETIADVGSAADFVRVARDADGFGAGVDGEEDDVFGGGAGRGGKKGKISGSALGRAMGAVGGSFAEAGGGGRGGGHGKGKKKRRRR